MMNQQPRHSQPSSEGTPAWDRRYLFHYAAEYRDRGWSVIPLRGKKPALASWKEFQERRPTLGEVAVWWGGPRPQFDNMGIVTGQLSGLIVVDCDDPQDAMWWQQQYPTPLMVRTGSGGTHYYYRAPQEVVRNRIRLFGRRIDLRGTGGVVVAPPSVHPDTQLSYMWHPEQTDYALDAIPLFEPAWMPEIATRPHHSGGDHSRKRIHDARAYIQRIDAVAGQGGHAATFRATCILRDAGLSPEECLAELISWNQLHAHPAWSVAELLHKVQSSFAAHTSAAPASPDRGNAVL